MSSLDTPEIQARSSDLEQNSIQQLHSQERDTTALNSTVPQERLILESMLENLDDRAQLMRRVQAVEDISQAPKQQRREKIKLWAARLEVHPRTVTRLLERVEKEGLASLVRFTRIDAGATRGSKQWQGKSVAQWTDFILTTYKRGNKSGRRMNRSQVFNQVISALS